MYGRINEKDELVGRKIGHVISVTKWAFWHVVWQWLFLSCTYNYSTSFKENELSMHALFTAYIIVF